MAMRSLWNGQLQWKLMSVPVKLYKAVESPPTSFSLVHADPDCHGAVGKKDFCRVCGQELEKDEVCRVHDGVVVSNEEYEAMQEDVEKVLAIDGFTKEVDRSLLDESFFLKADGPAAGRVVNLIRSAMLKSKTVAVGQWGYRGRQRPVVVESTEGGVMIRTLHYPEYVRSITDVPAYVAPVAPAKAELDAAVQLVKAMTVAGVSDFKLVDDKAALIKKITSAKSKGKRIEVKKPSKQEAAIDLIGQLNASLAQ